MNKFKAFCIGCLGRHLNSQMDDMQYHRDNKNKYNILWRIVTEVNNFFNYIYLKTILPIYVKLTKGNK